MGRMNVKMIKDMAILYKKYDIDNVNAILWINSAMSDLAKEYDTARKTLTQTLVVNDVDTLYDLPDDTINILRIENENKMRMDDFLLVAGKLKFSYTGTYTIFYSTVCDNVLEITDIPEVNALYHECIAKYVAYKEMFRVNKSDPLGTQLYAEYMNDAAKVNDILSNVKRTRRLTPKNYVSADY